MPPEFPVRPPGYGAPLQGGPEVVQIPHGPRQYAPRAAEPQVIRPRRDHPLNVQIRQAGDSSSPSPPTPLREHRRKYEELKRQVRETERRDHIERQRRDQAERDAQEANEREIERLQRENLELLRRERRRLEQEERRHNQERQRRRMEEQEERQQRRLESEQQERRRRRQEANEREQARRRQEREDRQALQEEFVREQMRTDRMRRDQDERDRIERQRRAGIPRGPRHRPEVHHRRRVSFEERGDQVIDDAIREQDRRRFETRAPVPPRRGWSRHRDVGGGLRRRDTIAVTERGVYEDDRRRGGRRWI